MRTTGFAVAEARVSFLQSVPDQPKIAEPDLLPAKFADSGIQIYPIAGSEFGGPVLVYVSE